MCITVFLSMITLAISYHNIIANNNILSYYNIIWYYNICITLLSVITLSYIMTPLYKMPHDNTHHDILILYQEKTLETLLLSYFCKIYLELKRNLQITFNKNKSKTSFRFQYFEINFPFCLYSYLSIAI